MINNVEIKDDRKGGYAVYIDGVMFGLFDRLETNGEFCFFPRKTDQLTGDDFIAIGESLNWVNSAFTNNNKGVDNE